MTVLIGSDGYVRSRFESCSNPYEITGYLKHMHMYAPKRYQMLYHYSDIGSILSIIDTGYLWLGPIGNMNDYLENEFYNSFSDKKHLYLSSFSKTGENLAMYKMYSNSESGAVISIPYRSITNMVRSLSQKTSGLCDVYLVKDRKVTNETVEAEVYVTSVCYKDLHTNTLKCGSVENTMIDDPLNNPELIGYIKLDGWEFEKEVRICAVTNVPLLASGENRR